MEIKQGDLVTVQLDENNQSSNVYVVARKLDGECILNHPLYPNCLILKKDSELNIATAAPKSASEKCLEFITKNRDLVDFGTMAEIHAMCAYFIINRILTRRQLRFLSTQCGRLASQKLNSNVSAAIKKVAENQALLDEYNLSWFNNLRDVYAGKRIPTPNQRETIFNQAGFVFAQLEINRVPQKSDTQLTELDNVGKTK